MQILPNAEAVFTEEYWEPIPPASTYYNPEQSFRTRMLGARAEAKATFEDYGARNPIDRETKIAARESLCLAVNMLLEGQETEAIKPGEYLGVSRDNTYALPGAVLLIDEEDLVLKPIEEEHMPATTMSETEIGMSAISCLLSKGLTRTTVSAPFENYAILNMYSSSLYSSLGAYYRKIGLYAFCQSKKGRLTSRGLDQWRNEPEGPRAVSYHNHSYIPYPSTVGETARALWSTKHPSFSRVREARLCIAGTRVQARVKAKKGKNFVPRLVATPGI